jgi:hypothetical protein
VLAYGLGPERVAPFDSLELALAEARVAGGNYILSVDPRYRAALLEGRGNALADWKRLGATAAWLKRHSELFGGPAAARITALVDEGEWPLELVKMLFRHNAAPAVEPAAAPPKPDPERRLVIAAAGLKEPAGERILAHAEAGTTVVTDRGDGKPWWRADGLRLVRDEADRETFRLGRGRLVVYKEAVSDPSEFALDVIDLATHARRAVRLWNAPAVIAFATYAPPRTLLILVNYGRALEYEMLCRVHGAYSSAVLLRPEEEPAKVRTARRGEGTEVVLPRLRRVGVVQLE